jgi:replication factor A1
MKTIAQIEEQSMNATQPFHYIVKATIQFIKTNFVYYPSCPLRSNGRQCKKKVVQNVDEAWTCAKCKDTFADCVYRYVLQLKLADHTGTLWVISFDEPATCLLGMSAQKLHMLQFNQESKIDAETVINQVCLKQFLFTISVVYDSSVGQGRLKSTITKVDTLNLDEENASLPLKVDDVENKSS